ncbi:MAG: universal stress protein [Syntrophobacteraceae bacterium]|nr:universal stress protein [Syntrophobacteraceae bacterium]
MVETMDSGSRQVNEANQKGKKNPKIVGFLWICLVGAGLSLGYWWLFMRNRVSTDNAYVVADSAAVSSRVAGSISRIAVENEDEVMAGALLVQLDPRDYQAEVDRQRAALARTQSEIEMAEVILCHVVRSFLPGFGHLPFQLEKEVEEQLMKGLNQKITGMLDAYGECLEKAGVEAQRIEKICRIGSYSLSAEILDVARQKACGTIIMGRRGISAVREFLMGRVTSRVLSGAEGLAVWIVP